MILPTARAFILLLVGILSVVPDRADAGLEIVAENLPPLPADPDLKTPITTAFFGVGNDSGNVFDNKIIQTFQATRSAAIDFVMFRMKGTSSTALNPRIRIVRFNEISGLVQNELGEAFIASSSIPASHPSSQISRLNVFADFRGKGVNLVNGSSYALLLDIGAGQANHSIEKTTYARFDTSQSFWRSQNSATFSKGNGSLLFQVVSGYDATLAIHDYKANYFYPPPENYFDQSAFIHRLRWVAEPGKTYRARHSKDLTNWSDLNLSNYSTSAMIATVPLMTLDWTVTLSNFPLAIDFFGYYRIEEVE